MKVWSSFSSESRKCRGCDVKTGNYKVYDLSEIAIRIPLCDDCYGKVDVEKLSKPFLTTLRKTISIQVNEDLSQ